MPMSGSRTEFLAVDALGSASDIQYGRTGGWFLTTKKALLLGLLVITGMVVVGILVHYLATCKGGKSSKDASTGSEPSVITPTAGSNSTTEPPIPAAELLLPTDVTPTYYRLILEPYLEDSNPDGHNFTYRGHVSIRIQCHNATSRVSLHVKNLVIGEDIKIALYNETASETTGTSASTSPSSTAPGSTPGTAPEGNTTVPETAVTLPASSTNATAAQNTTTAAKNTTATTPAGSRNKRSVLSKKRHGRRQAPSTTTLVPMTTYPPGTPPQVAGRLLEERKDMYTMSVEPPLKAGHSYTLDIPFTGMLRDSLYGFYRSSYKNASGNKMWMATTQFEAPHAREAFPCFDEPAMKAQFEISIARGVKMTTVSNMRVRSTEPVDGQPGRVWDHYEVSPVMSTYLVAFIVAHSDFIPTNDTMATYMHTKEGNKSGPEFRIYARKQLIEGATYASSIGPRVLEYYEEYFGIPYPLPKMHMAAIPDFAAGAMENWGLLTYREARLLYDPKSSSMLDKDRVAIVVAHEIAHQWFGNLVTMKWWSDLWLNEGFATYMQYVGSDHVEPTWAMQDKFLVYEQQPAMALDCLRSTHPVSTKVDNPSQISEIFDYISYSKGASLIRMLNNSLTEDVLRKGLTHYLNKWKYSNADENDLWDALTEQILNSSETFWPANVTVQQVMDTWTLQDGYPVLSVTRDYNHGSAMLSQARFTLDNSSTDTLWYIPVSYATQEEMNDATNSSRRTFPRLWLKQESTTTVPNLTKPKSTDNWVLFNIHATGYYRVNYDARNWELLATYLLNSPPEAMLPAITRAQLLDDALNLARAGTLGYDVALNVTRYLATRENHYVPWRAALENMKFLYLMLRETTTYGTFQDYMLKTLTTMKTSLGFVPNTNETQLQTLLRPKILMWLSKMGDPAVVKWAKDLFQQWTNSSSPDTNNPIPVDFREVVYCTAVKTGGREEWMFVMNRYLAAADRPSESDVLLTSLVCTQENWLLITLLEKSLESDGGIRLQDAIRVWDGMSSSATSSRVAFNYIRNKWSFVYDTFGNDEFLMGYVLKGAISGLTTKLDNKDVQEFYNANKGKFSFAERKMKQEMEGLQLRVDWNNSFYSTIASWLHNYHDRQ